MSTENNIALLVDIDNYAGFCVEHGYPKEFKPVLASLGKFGKTRIARSFGDINKLPMDQSDKRELRQALLRYGFRHEDVPYHNRFKNSADIRLVIEAIALVTPPSSIDTVAIIANDSDYIPLFHALRERGVTTIGICANKRAVGETYHQACEHVLYYEDLMPGDDSLKKVMPFLAKASRQVESRGIVSVGAAIVPEMRRISPQFEKTFGGFSSFRRLVESAEKFGYITSQAHGLDIQIALTEKGLGFCTATDDDAGEAVPLADQYAEYLKREWGGAQLTDPRLREVIYQEIMMHLRTYRGVGIGQADLIEQVHAVLAPQSIEHAAVRTMVRLLSGVGAFDVYSSDGEPWLMKLSVDPENLDEQLMIQIIRQFKRHAPDLTCDPAVWSELLIGDNSSESVIAKAYRFA